MKEEIHIFDFDGTLTKSDSLIGFIRHARGSLSLIAGLLHFSPWLVLMKFHLVSNGKVKQSFFSHFFQGESLAAFDAYCRSFAEQECHILRPKGMERMVKVLLAGARVMVVSASIDNWVEPFIRSELDRRAAAYEDAGAGRDADLLRRPRLRIIGTKVEVRSGRLTGRFVTKNCYGQEKVNRIEEVLPRRGEYEINAYGDSRGDKEMLEYADKGYYKPFR